MTEEPTPEQIEVARDAMMRVGAGRFGLTVVEHGMSILDAYGELARAALVAAAGGALPATSTITEDQLRSLEMSTGSWAMKNALEAVGIAVGAPKGPEEETFSFDEIESAAWAVGFLMSKHAYDAITSREGARVMLKDLYEKLASEAARLRGGER